MVTMVHRTDRGKAGAVGELKSTIILAGFQHGVRECLVDHCGDYFEFYCSENSRGRIVCIAC